MPLRISLKHHIYSETTYLFYSPALNWDQFHFFFIVVFALPATSMPVSSVTEYLCSGTYLNVCSSNRNEVADREEGKKFSTRKYNKTYFAEQQLNVFKSGVKKKKKKKDDCEKNTLLCNYFCLLAFLFVLPIAEHAECTIAIYWIIFFCIFFSYRKYDFLLNFLLNYLKIFCGRKMNSVVAE